MPKNAVKATVATCPPADTLAQLASGSLAEERAEPLFAHIDNCETCQQLIDDLNQRADGLIAAARKPESAVETQVARVDSLIRNAQKLKSKSTARFDLTSRRTTAPTKRVSKDAFIDGLRRSGLFKIDEVVQFVASIDAEDSSHFAKELIDRGKLTPFQARSLLKGKWKGFVLGNYVILDKLGQGGMGSVFKARHERMGRVVCIKVMNSTGRKSPELMQRFRQEARTIGALNHPNIVVAHDADEANGIPFLVMEYIEGNDLAREVNKEGPLSTDLAILITTQAAHALSYAHKAGVVHRDIKPHNLLLSDPAESDSGSGSVKVLDMGLARFDSFMADNPDASVHAAMTNTGVIMGTVDYMAPEQAIRTRDADNRSDIYSLGCTLHYLLTGKPVYEGETIMARLIAHRETPVPSLRESRPDVTPELDAVFARMIAKSSDDRYQSMDDLLTDLKSITDGEQPIEAMAARAMGGSAGTSTLVAAPRESIVEKTRQRASRSKRSLFGWVGGLVIGVLLSFGLMQLDTGRYAPQKKSSGVVRPLVIKEETADGHRATLRNGGKGRAVFLLPTEKNTYFDDKQFVAIQKALESRGVEWAIMGGSERPAQPKHGKLKKKVKRTISIDEFDPKNFDAIFVVEGEMWDLMHASHTSLMVRTAFEKTMKAGKVVTVFGKACQIIEKTNYINGTNFKRYDGLQIGKRTDTKGTFVKIEHDCDINKATDLIFSELVDAK